MNGQTVAAAFHDFYGKGATTMAEYPKLQTYKTMAVQHTATITGSFDTWTAFLRTAARIYKDVFCKG